MLISGLVNALNLIKDIKEKYSGITYADLFQLASATAIEVRSIVNVLLLVMKTCTKIFGILGSRRTQNTYEIWKS